jgi:transcriptional regulator with XRE-family HTH domain
MSYIGTYLDQLIVRRDLKSDSDLANHLEISRQHLSRIRSDGRVLSEELCYRIARDLDINPLELFAYVRAQKCKTPEIRAIWMDLHRQVKRVKASILLNSN